MYASLRFSKNLLFGKVDFGTFFLNTVQMETGIRKYQRFRLHRIDVRGVNTVLAYAASMMLTGIPPEVCETTINEVYCSVKKSISNLLH
jgi:hypothetical protein